VGACGGAVKTRRALAAAGLAAFLLGQAWHARPEPRARWSKLSTMARTPESQRRLSGTSFFFDPGFGPFLEAVRRATPPGATIAFKAPLTHELYSYTASYVLAPRRLVAPDRLEEAQYAAVYGIGPARGFQIALPVANGSLFRLR
jgi:hypothetical protein